MIRKDINTIGFDASIGYLHEIDHSKHPLVYDLQELFRYVVDYSVIELLESGLKKLDFITTGNYHIRWKPNTAKPLAKKIKKNFNQRYEFRNKQYALENIMFENINELSRYITGNNKQLEFLIPGILIERNDNSQIRERIMSIDPEKKEIVEDEQVNIMVSAKKD